MALISAIRGVGSSSRRGSIMARPCDGIQEVGQAGRSISSTEFSTEGSTPPATEVVAETVNKGRLFGHRFPVGHFYKAVPPLFGDLAMRFWVHPPLGSAPGP